MDVIQLVFILALIVVNGLFAMSEIAILSSRKMRLQRSAEAGQRGARAALELADSPGPFLSTVQIGITLVGILAGAVGEASFAEEIKAYLAALGLPEAYGQLISVAVVVLGIAYLSLVIGELAPKRAALIDPERIAARVAPPMKLLSRLAAPLVWVLNVSTNFVLRALGIRASGEPPVTEEEVKYLVDQGTELGVFEPIEDQIVDQAFRLSDQRVISLIVPRSEIVWLDVDDPAEVIFMKVRDVEYSQFPVAKDDLDHLLGYIKAVDLFSQCWKRGALEISNAICSPLFVPEKLHVYEALERLREAGAEIAFILDEFGGVEGMVTLRDILEALIGGLSDDRQRGKLILQREDGSWLVDGMTPAQDFREWFKLGSLPGEEQGYFQTLAGFILNYLGRIPQEGDELSWAGLRFEVLDMDGRRVDKVLVTPAAETGTEG
ncbi:MAG: HlyC/CorC family transporter [Anaerolineales bacterium]|nr:HlyC/CorC family transporter [Anaerolineales bacterium]